jgi:hypothetical protein
MIGLKWIALLAVIPLLTGMAAGHYWRASNVLEALGCGLVGAIGATFIVAPLLPLAGWGIFGVFALVLTPLLCMPAAVAGAVVGMTLRAASRAKAKRRPK